MPKKSTKSSVSPNDETSLVKQGRFVIHEHHASHLHFDFRLEMAGTLKSWAIPKGPSLNPEEKRLAVEVEDHAVSYINFEGRIAEGKYGAGEVRIWDNGEYLAARDAFAQLKAGRLRFVLRGKKLQGEFTLIKMVKRDRQWLLIKSRDEFADADWRLETVLKIEKR